MTDVTHILSDIEQGDPDAAERLLPLVYEELRKLAAQRLVNEKPGQTLQATALVHEAYIKLVDVDKAQHWNSRGHFFGAAAEAMRRILVDNARRKASPMHGGDRLRVELHDICSAAQVAAEDLLSIDEALTKLAQVNPSPNRSARTSAPTSWSKRSARVAWAASSWPSRKNPFAARWR